MLQKTPGSFAGNANGPLSSTTIVGVSGDIGSFSEKAASGWIAENEVRDTKLEYLIEIENVLAALTKGSIGVGVFPIFNNSIGIIDPAIEAMSKYNFTIVDKIPLLVEHCLLVRTGVSKEQIDTITSQQPAIDQCERRLHRYWRHTKIDPYADTAKAARDLAEGVLPETTAVIGSLKNSKVYGLDVLERPFQDDAENMTVFLVARQRR